jgi:hypothetical protein
MAGYMLTGTLYISLLKILFSTMVFDFLHPQFLLGPTDDFKTSMPQKSIVCRP